MREINDKFLLVRVVFAHGLRQEVIVEQPYCRICSFFSMTPLFASAARFDLNGFLAVFGTSSGVREDHYRCVYLLVPMNVSDAGFR